MNEKIEAAEPGKSIPAGMPCSDTVAKLLFSDAAWGGTGVCAIGGPKLPPYLGD